MIRRLDHVAVAIRDTEEALRMFRDRLGLAVVHFEVSEQPPVRLTYLDTGNTYLQLVEPLAPDIEIGRWIEEHGEGIHHLCFGSDDPLAEAAGLSPDGAPEPVAGGGRGRVSVFVPGGPQHGVRIECTEFRRHEDVARMRGWLK